MYIFTVKFQAAAEKNANNFKGLLFAASGRLKAVYKWDISEEQEQCWPEALSDAIADHSV